MIKGILRWYRNLAKPAWQPPEWLLPPVWTIVLGLAGWGVAIAWRAADADGRDLIIAMSAVNMVLYFLWPVLFAVVRRPDWAAIEAVALWLSVLALCIGLQRFSLAAGWLTLPYLLWCGFATVLNIAIARLNSPYGQPFSALR